MKCRGLLGMMLLVVSVGFIQAGTQLRIKNKTDRAYIVVLKRGTTEVKRVNDLKKEMGILSPSVLLSDDVRSGDVIEVRNKNQSETVNNSFRIDLTEGKQPKKIHVDIRQGSTSAGSSAGSVELEPMKGAGFALSSGIAVLSF